MPHNAQISPEMRACIEECLRCHAVCLGTATHHCLETGGGHVAPAHFRTMLACAEICQSAANVMLTGSQHHRAMCRICAEICEECAQSCEKLGGMKECVEACRRSAASCRRMAS